MSFDGAPISFPPCMSSPLAACPVLQTGGCRAREAIILWPEVFRGAVHPKGHGDHVGGVAGDHQVPHLKPGVHLDAGAFGDGIGHFRQAVDTDRRGKVGVVTVERPTWVELNARVRDERSVRPGRRNVERDTPRPKGRGFYFQAAWLAT
jgi:hypothetical protein